MLSKSRFRISREKSIPLLVTLLFGVIAIAMWTIASREEAANFKDGFADTVNETQSHLIARLTEASNALRRYAARVEVIGIKNERFLEVDSHNYLSQLPILSRIGIVDAKFKTVWSFPADLRAQVDGFDQATVPARREAFESARDKKISLLSKTVELRSGGQGNLIPVALFRDGVFAGAVYGAIKTGNLFADLLKPEDFRLELREDGKTIYSSQAKSEVIEASAVMIPAAFGLADFQIVMTPTETYRQAHSSRTPLLILIFGELFALMLGVALYRYMAGHKYRLIDLEWRKTMLQGAGHAVIAIDTDGIIQTFSRAAELLLGYSAEEMIGKKTPTVFHLPSEIAKRAEILSIELGRTIEPGLSSFVAKLDTTTLPDVNEWTYVRKDGTRISVSVSATSVRDVLGRITGYLAIASDLTAQKKADDDIRVAHERLQRVVASTGEGIWERDLHTREVRFIDEQARKVLGFGKNEDVTHEKVMLRIHRDDHADIQEALIDHQVNQTPQFDINLRIVDGDQPLRWVRFRGRIVRKGQDGQLVSTLSDITETVTARLQLEKALADSESVARAKAAFFSTMSHEIRTPLNGIIGMTDLLLDTTMNPKQVNFAKIIQTSGSSLLYLLNEILDFSKLESGKMELETTDFNLASVVESQIEILLPKAHEKKISLVSFVSPSIPAQVSGDPARIGQILLNLLSNALKFTSVGHVSVRVRPFSNGGVDRLRFEVRDSGIGMNEKEMARLFQPFNQANSGIGARFGGTGLGLSISKKIVEALGGTIGVESVEGSGSTFWFEIPLILATSFNQGHVGWEKLVGIKTLLYDEDEGSRVAIAEYLATSKMKATSVATLDAALLALTAAAKEKMPYKVVVVAGAKIDAREVATRLRTAAGSAVPSLIYVSEFASEDHESDLLAAGFQCNLEKPIKQSKLLNAMVAGVTGVGFEIRAQSVEVTSVRAVEKSNFKILIADDVSVNRMLTTAMLDYLGHSSQSVANGSEALEALKQGEYDLILMDCQMPEMDGYEATTEIRKSLDEKIRTIPIIALTANALPEDQRRCLKAGMNDYLSKPMKREQLATVLNKWLKVSKTARVG